MIGCCACLGENDAKNFYFAGVCRSKTVRPIDDGAGPQVSLRGLLGQFSAELARLLGVAGEHVALVAMARRFAPHFLM